MSGFLALLPLCQNLFLFLNCKLYKPIISRSSVSWNLIDLMSNSHPNLIINTFEKSVLHQFLDSCITISQETLCGPCWLLSQDAWSMFRQVLPSSAKVHRRLSARCHIGFPLHQAMISSYH